jgi:hypothetical protein
LLKHPRELRRTYGVGHNLVVNPKDPKRIIQ